MRFTVVDSITASCYDTNSMDGVSSVLSELRESFTYHITVIDNHLQQSIFKIVKGVEEDIREWT